MGGEEEAEEEGEGEGEDGEGHLLPLERGLEVGSSWKIWVAANCLEPAVHVRPQSLAKPWLGMSCHGQGQIIESCESKSCLLYTSDAADE